VPSQESNPGLPYSRQTRYQGDEKRRKLANKIKQTKDSQQAQQEMEREINSCIVTRGTKAERKKKNILEGRGGGGWGLGK